MPNITSKNPTSSDYVPKFATANSITNSPIIIDVNDNVGIGKTPAVKLDVDGVIQMTGFNLTSGPAAGYVLTSDTGGIGTWGPPGVGGNGTANFLPKFTSANAIGNSVISESGGNIGIGTTTPSTKLEVNGTARLGGTAPAPGVYIDGTGNVGIGTSAPSQKLDVNGNININGSVQALQSMLVLNGLTGRSTSAATPAGVFDGAPGGKILSGQVAGLEKFSVDASGNVQASGTAQVSGIKLPTGASNGYVLTSDATGNASWLPPSGGGAVGGTGTANAVPKFTDPTTIGDSLVYETDGNVGIGTPIPQEELTLAQDSNIATEMQEPTNITYGFKSTGGLPADDYFFVLSASDGVGWTKGTPEIQVILGASDHTINLVWDTVVGATNYRVYRALTPGGPYKFIETNVTNFVYTDDGLFSVSGTPPEETTAYVNKFSAAGSSWLVGGKVGIGTSNPRTPLHIVGTPVPFQGETPGTLRIDSAVSALYTGNYQTIDFSFQVGQRPFARIGAIHDGGGSSLRFGTSSDYSYGITNTAMTIDSIGRVIIHNTLIQSSSRSLKTNIQPIDNALHEVMKLCGVTFDWKSTGKHDIGLIAEDVEKIIPEVVLHEENSENAQGLDYSRLVAVLIEAVKQQQGQIEELQEKVTSLLEHKNGTSATVVA